MEEAVVGRALRRATWLRPRPSCSVDASSASPSSTLRPANHTHAEGQQGAWSGPPWHAATYRTMLEAPPGVCVTLDDGRASAAKRGPAHTPCQRVRVSACQGVRFWGVHEMCEIRLPTYRLRRTARLHCARQP